MLQLAVVEAKEARVQTQKKPEAQLHVLPKIDLKFTLHFLILHILSMHNLSLQLF